MPRQVKVADDCSTHLYLFQVKIKYLFGAKVNEKKKKSFGASARKFGMSIVVSVRIAPSPVYPPVRPKFVFVHPFFADRALPFFYKSNKFSTFFLHRRPNGAPFWVWRRMQFSRVSLCALRVLFAASASHCALCPIWEFMVTDVKISFSFRVVIVCSAAWCLCLTCTCKQVECGRGGRGRAWRRGSRLRKSVRGNEYVNACE